MKICFTMIFNFIAVGILIAAPVPKNLPKALPEAPSPKEILPLIMTEPESPYEKAVTLKVTEPLFTEILEAQTILSLNEKKFLPENEYFVKNPQIINAICYLAIQDQVLDEQDASMFASDYSSSYTDNILLLINRYFELRDAPKKEASFIFPKNVYPMLKFNRDCKNFLENKLIWENDRADIINPAIDETDYLYNIWDAIGNATSDNCSVYYRRLCLLYLKKELGEFPKELPPCIPIWRFSSK